MLFLTFRKICHICSSNTGNADEQFICFSPANTVTCLQFYKLNRLKKKSVYFSLMNEVSVHTKRHNSQLDSLYLHFRNCMGRTATWIIS